MAILISKVAALANGVVQQMNLLDAQAILQATAIEAKGVTLLDANGQNPSLLNQAILSNLIVLQGTVEQAGSAAKMAADAEANAKTYADGLAPNYDAAGSAVAAEGRANSYADSAANTAVSTAGAYTDGQIMALEQRSNDYADAAVAALDPLPDFQDGLVFQAGGLITQRSYFAVTSDTTLDSMFSIQSPYNNFVVQSGSQLIWCKEDGTHLYIKTMPLSGASKGVLSDLAMIPDVWCGGASISPSGELIVVVTNRSDNKVGLVKVSSVGQLTLIAQFADSLYWNMVEGQKGITFSGDNLYMLVESGTGKHVAKCSLSGSNQSFSLLQIDASLTSDWINGSLLLPTRSGRFFFAAGGIGMCEISNLDTAPAVTLFDVDILNTVGSVQSLVDVGGFPAIYATSSFMGETIHTVHEYSGTAYVAKELKWSMSGEPPAAPGAPSAPEPGYDCQTTVVYANGSFYMSKCASGDFRSFDGIRKLNFNSGINKYEAVEVIVDSGALQKKPLLTDDFSSEAMSCSIKRSSEWRVTSDVQAQVEANLKVLAADGTITSSISGVKVSESSLTGSHIQENSVAQSKIVNLANDLASLQSQIDNAPSSLEWQDSVLSKLNLISDLPASPVDGDRHLVLEDNKIYTRKSGAWESVLPTTGTFVSVDNETVGVYHFGGSSWTLKIWENPAMGSAMELTGSGAGVINVKTGGIQGSMIATNAVDETKILSTVFGNGITKPVTAGPSWSSISQAQDNQNQAFAGYRYAQKLTIQQSGSIQSIDIVTSHASVSDVLTVELWLSSKFGTSLTTLIGSTTATGSVTNHHFQFASPVSVSSGAYIILTVKSSANFRFYTYALPVLTGFNGGFATYDPGATSSPSATSATSALKMSYNYVDSHGKITVVAADSSISVTSSGIAVGTITDSNITDESIAMAKIAGLSGTIDSIGQVLNQKKFISEAIGNASASIGEAKIVMPTSTGIIEAKADSLNNCKACAGVSVMQYTLNQEVKAFLAGSLTMVYAQSGVSIAIGDIVYLSDVESGRCTNVAPTAAGSVVVELGVATAGTGEPGAITQIVFNPRLVYVIAPAG
jgi:hypothetical protein